MLANQMAWFLAEDRVKLAAIGITFLALAVTGC